MTASVIGSDLVVVGSLHAKGEVHVDGEVQGDVMCGSLLVGEGGQVTGNVMAEEIIIEGHVQGTIRGVRITLRASSHVEGDVFHKSLAIEQGAFFEGKSRRVEDPFAGAADTAPAASAANGRGHESALFALIGGQKN